MVRFELTPAAHFSLVQRNLTVEVMPAVATANTSFAFVKS